MSCILLDSRHSDSDSSFLGLLLARSWVLGLFLAGSWVLGLLLAESWVLGLCWLREWGCEDGQEPSGKIVDGGCCWLWSEVQLWVLGLSTPGPLSYFTNKKPGFLAVTTDEEPGRLKECDTQSFSVFKVRCGDTLSGEEWELKLSTFPKGSTGPCMFLCVSDDLSLTTHCSLGQ